MQLKARLHRLDRNEAEHDVDRAVAAWEPGNGEPLVAHFSLAELEGVELLVADLDVENPEALVGLGMPVLGFYSHVNAETREVAEAAGVDLVVPRSRLAREMPQLAARLLEG